MPHPEEKKMDDVKVIDSAFVASFDDLVDVLPNILGFLPPKDIMRQRRVCRKCCEAVKKTIVPLTDFCIDSLKKYNAMVVMTEALPNFQQIKIGRIRPRPEWGRRHKFSDGEDPDEEMAAETAAYGYTSHDIEIISNFSKLGVLEIYDALLNGRYSFLFNSFPLLQKLRLNYCNLKWDLEMLAALPLLKELQCKGNHRLTGNISSLRVLKNTLEKVEILHSSRVVGNFMDLADFPHLKVLDLLRTAVTGDIRDIGDNNFSALERLRLPKSVYGGIGYELQRISEAPNLVRAVYLFGKQRPTLSLFKNWLGKLSEDSPDWYESLRKKYPPPFHIQFVEAGDRIGYQWDACCHLGFACEVNWLDPEPSRESSEYAKYIEKLPKVSSQVYFYKGFYQPPVEEEYQRLVEEETQRRRAERSERLTVG